MWPTATVAEAGKISCCPNYGQIGLSNHPKIHGYSVQREKGEKSRAGQPAPDSLNSTGNRRERSESRPTPQEDNANNCGSRDGKTYKDLTVEVKKACGSGRLNPDWVCTLMGLPVGWVSVNDEGKNRIDELRLLGNGCVPQTVEVAFRTLLKTLIDTGNKTIYYARK
jgi:hypothetical protein